MTDRDFRAWLLGFTSCLGESAPTVKQWAEIKRNLQESAVHPSLSDYLTSVEQRNAIAEQSSLIAGRIGPYVGPSEYEMAKAATKSRANSIRGKG